MGRKTVDLSSNMSIPAIGLGSWYLGDDPSKRTQELAALRTGINAGMWLIDTAEMYGSGRSERLVGEAIRQFDRKTLFLVSKVLPLNAGEHQIFQSCEESLKRLGTDYLDLYLLHWRGNVPLPETAGCMELLKKSGKIREWGVSNFDTADMVELWEIPEGKNCRVNQVLYHMGSRGIEFDLLPWMRDHHVALMAYCPLAQGGTLKRGLLANPAIRMIAAKHQSTVEQVLLAWCIRDGNTVAIPRSGNPEHILQNAQADTLSLDEADIAQINTQYAPPVCKMGLDIQ